MAFSATELENEISELAETCKVNEDELGDDKSSDVSESEENIGDNVDNAPDANSKYTNNFFGLNVNALWKKKKRKKRFGKTVGHVLPKEVSGPLEKANDAFIKGDNNLAIFHLSEVVRLAPKFPDPYHIMGLIYEENKDFWHALQLFTIAARYFKKSIHAWEKVFQIAYYDLKRNDYALEAIRRMLSIKQQPIYLSKKALLEVALHSISAAHSTLNRFLTIYPNEIDFLIDFAQACVTSGYIERGISIFLRYLITILGTETVPADVLLYYNLKKCAPLKDITKSNPSVLFFAGRTVTDILLSSHFKYSLATATTAINLCIDYIKLFNDNTYDEKLHLQLPLDLGLLFGICKLRTQNNIQVIAAMRIIIPLLTHYDNSMATTDVSGSISNIDTTSNDSGIVNLLDNNNNNNNNNNNSNIYQSDNSTKKSTATDDAHIDNINHIITESTDDSNIDFNHNTIITNPDTPTAAPSDNYIDNETQIFILNQRIRIAEELIQLGMTTQSYKIITSTLSNSYQIIYILLTPSQRIDILYRISIILERCQKPQDAIETLLICIKEDPNHPRILLFFAELCNRYKTTLLPYVLNLFSVHYSAISMLFEMHRMEILTNKHKQQQQQQHAVTDSTTTSNTLIDNDNNNNNNNNIDHRYQSTDINPATSTTSTSTTTMVPESQPSSDPNDILASSSSAAATAVPLPLSLASIDSMISQALTDSHSFQEEQQQQDDLLQQQHHHQMQQLELENDIITKKDNNIHVGKFNNQDSSFPPPPPYEYHNSPTATATVTATTTRSLPHYGGGNYNVQLASSSSLSVTLSCASSSSSSHTPLCPDVSHTPLTYGRDCYIEAVLETTEELDGLHVEEGGDAQGGEEMSIDMFQDSLTCTNMEDTTTRDNNDSNSNSNSNSGNSRSEKYLFEDEQEVDDNSEDEIEEAGVAKEHGLGDSIAETAAAAVATSIDTNQTSSVNIDKNAVNNTNNQASSSSSGSWSDSSLSPYLNRIYIDDELKALVEWSSILLRLKGDYASYLAVTMPIITCWVNKTISKNPFRKRKKTAITVTLKKLAAMTQSDTIYDSIIWGGHPVPPSLLWLDRSRVSVWAFITKLAELCDSIEKLLGRDTLFIVVQGAGEALTALGHPSLVSDLRESCMIAMTANSMNPNPPRTLESDTNKNISENRATAASASATETQGKKNVSEPFDNDDFMGVNGWDDVQRSGTMTLQRQVRVQEEIRRRRGNGDWRIDMFIQAAAELSPEAKDAANLFCLDCHNVHAANTLIREVLTSSRCKNTRSGGGLVFESYFPVHHVSTLFPHSATTLLLAGHDLVVRHKYAAALHSYLAAFCLDPMQPVTSLAISVLLLFLSQHVLVKHRHEVLVKAFTFIFRYATLRLLHCQSSDDNEINPASSQNTSNSGSNSNYNTSSKNSALQSLSESNSFLADILSIPTTAESSNRIDTDQEHQLHFLILKQETLYNVGRIFDEIKLYHLALDFYLQALQLSDKNPILLQSSINLTREAAHNSVIIYKRTGNRDLALEIMLKYLCFD